MPYPTNEALPDAVRARYSDHCQTVFRSAWNAAYDEYGTEDRAFRVAHAAARRCMEGPPMRSVVKFVEGSRDTVEGLLAPYGGPPQLGGKDLDGEFFTAKTDFVLDWFGDWQRPLLYHHGKDQTVKASVVGRIKVEPTEKGLWMQAQLDKAHDYYDAIAELVDGGKMGLSSGAVAYLVDTDRKSGEIRRWPVVEGSLTPTPSNPDAHASLKYAIKSADAKEHLAVLGIAAPEELDEPDEGAKAEEPPEPEPVRIALETVISPAKATDLLLARLMDALTPQSIHDAAHAAGAKCSSEDAKSAPPAPLLAITGKSVETAEPLDLDALRADLSRLAIKTAEDLLGR